MVMALFQTMEGIDFSQEVIFSISMQEGRQTLFVKQKGNALKWKYTKQHPNGKPEWVLRRDADGNNVWDLTDELAFF